MTFTIHITHRHVEGAWLDNEYYERDEACDEDIDIEVDDGQVHEDIAEMVYMIYIREGFLTKEVPQGVREQMIDRLKLFFDDLDIWEKLEEDYKDELQEKYQEKYGDD